MTEYDTGDACPACQNHDSDRNDGTLHEHEETGDLICDDCGSVFSPRGTCKMNNLRRATPPWIDRHGEVDPIKKEQARINDSGPGRSYPDHFYDSQSNRRL